MRLCRGGLPVCSFFLFFLIGGLAVAGTFNDDFNDNEIDKEFWVIYKESPTGKIEEANGRIEVTDLSGGWDGVGIRFDRPIDFTKGKFTLEFDMFLRNTDGHAYFSSSAVETGIWDPPLFAFNGILSGGRAIWQFETNKDASVAPAFQIPIDQDNFHHYKVEFTPTADKKEYKFYTNVDNGDLGEASGTLNVGQLDPTNIYVYFIPEQESGINEFTYYDNVSISSPSIEGIIGHKEAVEPGDKLSTTWGQIKARSLTNKFGVLELAPAFEGASKLAHSTG